MDNDFVKRREPKKIKMPPLVDRSNTYDTMSWDDDSFGRNHENNSENNSQSISELESDSTD